MKQKNIKYLILFLACILFTSKLVAQEYNISYKKQTIEQVISDLKKKTGYEFVYQKHILANIPTINCTYHNVTLNQILDIIFYNTAELDYEVVEKTIILSKLEKDDDIPSQYLITGIVSDENGEPLIGANILQKASNSRAITNINGIFSLIVDGNNPTVIVSYIGMKEQEVRINRQKEKFFLIQMHNDIKQLDEVLVTGYQNLKRENATGAYQTISAKDLDNRYSGSIVSTLEGRVPGLVSYNNGKNENGEASLVIRGVGSFQAKTNPLVVVDGLPIEGSIESVNPYDIENITVLKDASAAAIYGARASNGVIVISTKKAKSEKLSIDFNCDITISEKNNYSNFGWASAAEMIELEKYNFDYLKNATDQTAFSNLMQYYNNQRKSLSPINRLLMANYLGEMSDQQLSSSLNQLSKNNYRKEWQDAMERTGVVQQYNLALRTQGKALSSSIVFNYKNNNNGTVNEYNNAITFAYQGNLKANRWLNFSFGVNLLNERAKTHIADPSGYGSIYSFQPYQSLYNEDGSLAALEADVYQNEESLNNSSYGFKSVSYNLLDEVNRNFQRSRRTNIRSFIKADVEILPEWRVSAQFQYEDIYYKSSAYYEADSYHMRNLYNLYTTEEYSMEEDWDTGEMIDVHSIKHNIPDGGILDTKTSEGAFYTFRLQTDYQKVFQQKHMLEGAAGFEFREIHTKTNGNLLMGYDDQTQSNSTNLVNYGQLKDMEGQISALGPNYSIYGAPTGSDFITTDELHRFYSLYFTGGYTYDRRYSATFSFRVDKTDLFGADPKFRGRPLWSTGLSWNLHNEEFLKDNSWIDILKMRFSYGLMGNIDQTVCSYLTASIGVNEINGNKVATLDTPPNDQLRWEKTTSWNAGFDFYLLRNRLYGSFDWYYKKGSDLLTVTDLDPTSGWSQLTINNGEALNRGIELQLSGVIVQPTKYKGLGIQATAGFTYNKNKVTKVSHQPATGAEALLGHTLHEGYPINSIFSYDFAGMVSEDNIQYFSWRSADGNIYTSDINSDEFTVADAIFCGGLDPKYVASFTPEISYGGFTLSAMFSYYGGHYMRARVDDWSSEGSLYGYNQLSAIDAIPASYLNYWRSGDQSLYPANGYLGGSNIVGDYLYMNTNVVPADFIKLRNVVLGYSFSRRICQRIGINMLRLRFQANNLAPWKKNNLGVDPESNNLLKGSTLFRAPRSYTMSISINL